MASKYARLKGAVQELPPPAVSDEVRAWLDSINDEDRDPLTLTQEFITLKREKARVAAVEKDINAHLAALDILIQRAYASSKLESVRLDGQLVYLSEGLSVSTVDRDALRTWALENGHERDLTIHSGTLNALTLARFEENETLPEGIALQPWTRVNMKKG